MKRGVTGTSITTNSESTVVVLQGVLEKVNKIGFNSRKLCVLTKSEFFYYSDHKARGSVKHISLQDIQAVKRDHSSKGFQFEIITQHKMETFAAESLEVFQQWLKAIQSTLLTTRRISVSSTSSGSAESARSPVFKYGGHGYEEVDIDEGGPKVASGNSSQPPKPTFQVHTYETVDVDEDKPREDKPKEDKPRTDKSKEDKLEIHEKKAKEEKPKIENPNEDTSKIDKPKENKSNRDKPKDDKPKVKPATRGVCRTVDALGGPPDSVLPRGNMSAQPKSSEKHSLPPVGVDSHKPARPKTPPPVSAKPTALKSPGHESKPSPAPRTRGVCTTVDAQRGPPGTTPANTSHSESPQEEPTLYSEVKPKRSDLYAECKKRKEEQQRQRSCEAEEGKLFVSPDSGYSEAYASVKQPNEQLYSEVSDVKTRTGERTQSDIYSLAKDIRADVLPPPSSRPPVSTPPASKTSVSTPPTSNTSLSTLPTAKTSVPTSPTSNTSVSTQPQLNTSVSTPPVSNTSVSTPPVSNTSVSTPSASNTSASILPASNTRVSTPPVSNTSVSTPPVSNTCTSTPISKTPPPTQLSSKPTITPVQPEEIYDDAASCPSSDQQANNSTPAESASQSEEIYNDASSCQPSEYQANPGSLPQTAVDQTAISANSHNRRDVNSNAIPIPSLRYGPVTRHEAINKLDEFLSACGARSNHSSM